MTTKPIETVIDKRTGDKPTNVPGEVTPGMKLRSRMGITEEKPQEPKPTAVPQPKPAKKPATAPQPAMDAATISSIASEAATAAVKSLKPDPEPTPALPKDTDGLTPEQERRYKVLLKMEEGNPKNAGKAKLFAGAARKFTEYRADWEKNNKGKKFDPEDDEHKEFLQDNDVPYDEDEYEEARIALLADERADKKLQPLREKLEAQEKLQQMQQREREEGPKIAQHARTSAKTFFNELGEEFKTILDDTGILNKDVEKSIADSNVHYPTIAATAQRVEVVTGEMKRIATGLAEIDAKSPVHVEIVNFVTEQEKILKGLPAESQMRDGKKFATSAEWAQMSPQKRVHHWHLSEDELSQLYAEEMSERVKAHIKSEDEKFNFMAERRGLMKRPATTQPAPAPRPTQSVPTSHSPAGAIAPRVAPIVSTSEKSNNPLLKRIVG